MDERCTPVATTNSASNARRIERQIQLKQSPYFGEPNPRTPTFRRKLLSPLPVVMYSMENGTRLFTLFFAYLQPSERFFVLFFRSMSFSFLHSGGEPWNGPKEYLIFWQTDADCASTAVCATTPQYIATHDCCSPILRPHKSIRSPRAVCCSLGSVHIRHPSSGGESVKRYSD